MKMFHLRSACFVTAAGLFLASQLHAQQSERTLSPFDGTSLQGWEADEQYWRVDSGTLVGEILPGKTLNKNTWAIWRGGELADFDLRLEFKLTGAPAANSGIQFRCQAENIDHVSGYQADLDAGQVWLGRIYDEHGRALLVERGARVAIDADGRRRTETFAPADQFAVLFRENDWNDYRIVAVGDHIRVYVNGTLFSELLDRQTGQHDRKGSLAFQLHSGPETKIAFRNVRLEHLKSDDHRMPPFTLRETESKSDPGTVPVNETKRALNLGFELGTLADWTATGDAFRGQPVKRDEISKRWAGQSSNKVGEFFIGGYEIVQDRGRGTLTSTPFRVAAPYASFLIGGGQAPTTRAEIVQAASAGAPEQVIFTAQGMNREAMRRVAVDLRPWLGKQVFVRLVDENAGGWGHLNFDDFRFHEEPPPSATPAGWRTTANPVLHHLVKNPIGANAEQPGTETTSQMFLPPGFSAEVVLAEPLLHQPIAFTFDARGRLWVVEGNSYPQKRPPGEGLDRILIFADKNGDGSFESRTVFMEGLNLVSGLEVGLGGVWIGAAPELLFIPDRDGDDRPDGKPQVLLDGFGFADTHETLNSFNWGPDGWLYGNQGVFNRSNVGRPGAADTSRVALGAGVWRYHPVRQVFEVFAHGGSNQWGLDYDEHGQFFMTHCRSFWGQGLTTHAMQGGHYWNQVNGGYAPFISAQAPADMPWLRNYLLASARYGHGEGGAGKPGSRTVYGGHSHVGTMIYLGDNWPAEYRNHLFTHNLHGHQINHQINVREAGGFNTRHAGADVLFCADQQYIGVDLKYGPDGAVYISDWYDTRHCHNPNAEQWDRRNGRIYRVKYNSTYHPRSGNVADFTDEQLVDAQLHANDWFVRKARLVLRDRKLNGKLAAGTADKLQAMASGHPDVTRRLRALWCLHAVEALDRPLVEKILSDESEYLRAWAVQLGIEALGDQPLADSLLKLAVNDRSLLVRRYLASAMPRVSPELGWRIARALSLQPENGSDRDLPLLLWHGIAKLMEHDPRPARELARSTKIPLLHDFVFWYSVKVSDEGRAEAVQELLAAEGRDDQLRRLKLFEAGVAGMRGLAAPPGWPHLASRLYESPDPAIQRAAESLGAAFGDEQLFDRMRETLSTPGADLRRQRHALAVLQLDASRKNVPVVLQLLDREELSAEAITLLGRFDDASIATELIERLPRWKNKKQAETAMEALASRAGWSEQLLDAIASGQVSREVLSAYYVRRMVDLGSKSLHERLAREWGTLSQSSAERKAEAAKLVGAFQAAPLWAYSESEGRNHFQKKCASCHQPKEQNLALAPSLAGSAAKGIGYIVENIVEPNAVIGRDYQTRVVVTNDGRVVNGLVEKETGSAITIRTAHDSVTLPKSDIESITISTNSFMPEGLLSDLNDRERIELLKYLMSL